MGVWHRWVLGWSMAIALAAGCSGSPVPMDRGAPAESEKQLQSSSLGGDGGFADDGTTANQIAAPPAAKKAESRSRPEPNAEVDQIKDKEVGGEESKAPDADADEPAPGGKKKAAKGLYIIRRASLTLEVKQIKSAMSQAAAMVKKHDGFISDSVLQASEGETPSARLTVRVPAERFEALLGALGNVGTVHARNVTGEDVTMEFVDTASRIRNLKKEETQLLKLLERTAKLLDVLTVERELARVRGEIEQAQGRLRHMANLVDLSTIDITLSEKVQVATPSPWQLGPVFENALGNAQRSLEYALAQVIEHTIWFGLYLLPVVLMAMVPYLILGWLAGALFVSRLKWLSAVMFRRLWIAIGLVGVASVWKDMFPLMLMLAVGLVVVWGVSWLVSRFFRRTPDLD